MLLRNGDRAGAYAVFRSAADTAPDNLNAWIGLALSSTSLDESADALVTAERLDPNSRFAAQAETDLTRRRPGFAEALAAARQRAASAPAPAVIESEPAAAPPAEAGPPAERAPVEPGAAADAPVMPAAETAVIAAGPRLGGQAELQPKTDDRMSRALLTLLVGVLALVVIGVVGLGLANSPIFGPPPPRPTATPTVAPTSTAVPAPSATLPVAQAPPSLTPVPATPTAVARRPLGATGSPTAVDPAVTAAISAVQAGRYADAIPALEAATERNPTDAAALYYLGVAYLNAPDRPHGAEDATLTLRTLQAQHPRWAPGLDMLARSLIAQGQFRDAVPPAHQAVESDPGRPEYWTTLARAYEGAGATAEATLAYAEAAKRSPTPAATPAQSSATPATGITTPALGSATPATGTTTPGAAASPTGSITPGIAATAEVGTTPGASATTTAGATGTATATPASSLLAPAGAGTTVPTAGTAGTPTATATPLPAPSGIR
jgi:Flp pilus assembly protein TadD